MNCRFKNKQNRKGDNLNKKTNIYNEMGYSSKDECYTTYNESLKLVNYLIKNNVINKEMIIWLPFDTEISNIYKVLIKHGFNVTISNLVIGLDFYNYQPEVFDIIISNPPFSNRTALMKRLLSFNKPFIILQGIQYFNNQHAVSFLSKYSDDFKFIFPRSRMSFITYDEKEKLLKSSKTGASFYSFWLCYKTKLTNTFNKLLDSGFEKEIEILELEEKTIDELHYNLFNFDDERFLKNENT